MEKKVYYRILKKVLEIYKSFQMGPKPKKKG